MTQFETLPLLDLTREALDTAQLEDTIEQVATRAVLGAQVQLYIPDNKDALLITERDHEFLEIVQRASKTCTPQFQGFNACLDIVVKPGETGSGWHIDTIEEWMDERRPINTFNGMSAHKTRVGQGTLSLQLGSAALLEEHEWLLIESADNALIADESLEEERFKQFISGARWIGELAAGRWTIFSHGMKQFDQLPLWHRFAQPAHTLREATAVFCDTATTDTSHVEFSGLAKPYIQKLYDASTLELVNC